MEVIILPCLSLLTSTEVMRPKGENHSNNAQLLNFHCHCVAAARRSEDCCYLEAWASSALAATRL